MGGRGAASVSALQTAKSLQLAHDYRQYDSEERIALLESQLGVSREQARDYAEAVFQWSIDKYSVIRAHQQNPNENIEGKRQAELIEDYITKSPKWGGDTTYRGINNVSPETFEKLTTIGTQIDMNGTSSWSTNEATSWEFASEGIVFVSKTQSLGTSIRHLARGRQENEVIVSKNAKYKVVNTGEFAGKTYVYLEEIQ